MISSEQTMREDINSNLEWKLIEGNPFTVEFSYTPSDHIVIPKHAKIPHCLTFTYPTFADFQENKDKAYGSAVNMFYRYMSGSEVEDFKTKRFAGFMFSRLNLVKKEGDTRSYVRVGRVEFYVDPSSRTSKAGFKFDKESERNPVFAIAFATEQPRLYAVTATGADK